MSLINGIGALGQGLAVFGAAGIKDAEANARVPLLNRAPRPAVASSNLTATPDDPAAPTVSTAERGAAGVPAKYLPFYEAAAKRTGIPIAVLIAQAQQESGFNPNAVGSAGEIGLHQIKPSTAQDPGYGLRGIDPATLKNAEVNINFAADYLRARAGLGADFSNPAAINAALRNYNGGGDPNYVTNVRRHMGAG